MVQLPFSIPTPKPTALSHLLMSSMCTEQQRPDYSAPFIDSFRAQYYTQSDSLTKLAREVCLLSAEDPEEQVVKVLLMGIAVAGHLQHDLTGWVEEDTRQGYMWVSRVLQQYPHEKIAGRLVNHLKSELGKLQESGGAELVADVSLFVSDFMETYSWEKQVKEQLKSSEKPPKQLEAISEAQEPSHAIDVPNSMPPKENAATAGPSETKSEEEKAKADEALQKLRGRFDALVCCPSSIDCAASIDCLSCHCLRGAADL